MPCSVYVLTSATFALGAVTLVALTLAVATDSWLLTREAVPSPKHPNGSVMDGTNTPLTVVSWSGLWRVCVSSENMTNFVMCQPIESGEPAEGRNNEAETTMIIVVAIQRAVPLPVAALILGTTAVIFTVVGSIHSDVKTLVGAVFFVLAGLALAVGIILYISAINDEVGYRANTRKGGAGFSYSYGWSFFSAGAGFLSSEMTAVVSVTLYLRRNATVGDMVQIIPGLEDKVDSELLVKEDGVQNPVIIL